MDTMYMCSYRSVHAWVLTFPWSQGCSSTWMTSPGFLPRVLEKGVIEGQREWESEIDIEVYGLTYTLH